MCDLNKISTLNKFNHKNTSFNSYISIMNKWVNFELYLHLLIATSMGKPDKLHLTLYMKSALRRID